MADFEAPKVPDVVEVQEDGLQLTQQAQNEFGSKLNSLQDTLKGINEKVEDTTESWFDVNPFDSEITEEQAQEVLRRTAEQINNLARTEILKIYRDPNLRHLAEGSLQEFFIYNTPEKQLNAFLGKLRQELPVNLDRTLKFALENPEAVVAGEPIPKEKDSESLDKAAKSYFDRLEEASGGAVEFDRDSNIGQQR